MSKKKKKPFEEGEANQLFLFSPHRSGSNLAISAAHLSHTLFSVLWSVIVCHGGTAEQKHLERMQVAQSFFWCCKRRTCVFSLKAKYV